MPHQASQRAKFYVHIKDPGFPDPPWPGERRLGPFLTVEEAHSQAVSDVAQGHISEENLIGVFDDSASAARDEHPDHAIAAVSADKIMQAAVPVRHAAAEAHARMIDDQRAALAIKLEGTGVSVDEFLDLKRAAA